MNIKGIDSTDKIQKTPEQQANKKKAIDGGMFSKILAEVIAKNDTKDDTEQNRLVLPSTQILDRTASLFVPRILYDAGYGTFRKTTSTRCPQCNAEIENGEGVDGFCSEKCKEEAKNKIR